MNLVPRDGGEPITIRQRYFETWRRNSSGEWKIDLYIDNMDVAPVMPGHRTPYPRGFLPTSHAETAERERSRRCVTFCLTNSSDTRLVALDAVRFSGPVSRNFRSVICIC